MSKKFDELYNDAVEYGENVFIKKYCLESKNEICREDTYNRFELELKKILDLQTSNTIMDRIRKGKIIPAGSIAFGLGNDDLNCSLSNCYFIPICKDSIDGIYDCRKEMANTFKSRGGAGTDLTILRYKGCPVKNSAKTSSGSVSFLPGFSEDARTIGQNGRRAAAIAILDIRHPDTLDFIWCKSRPETVFEKDFITGQLPDISAFNISLKINNDFMKAVEENKEWDFYFPDTSFEKYHDEWTGDYEEWESKGYPFITTGSINAKELLMQIAESAWVSGDPGVAFIDTIRDWSMSSFDPKTTPKGLNPCLPDWAPVLTPSGYRYFRDVKNEVLIDNKEYSCSDLIKTNNSDDVYLIELKNGLKTYTTKNHIIQKVTDYNKDEIIDVELQDLNIDDLIKTDYSKIKYKFNQDEWDDGYLSGLLYIDNKNHNPINLNFEERNLLIEKKDFRKLIGIIKDEQKLEIFKSSISFQLGFINSIINHNSEISENNQTVIINQMDKDSYSILSDIQLVLLSLGVYSELKETNEQRYQLEINDIVGFKEAISLFYNDEYKIILKNIIDEIDIFSYHHKFNKLKYCHEIKRICKLNNKYPVYDIQVPIKNYFVTSSIVVHNCGEQALADYENCLLSCIALHKYVDEPFTENATFDIDNFIEDVKIGIRFLNVMSDINEHRHPLKKQCEKDNYGKRVGQEFTGLGDMWAMLGHKYGSKEACEFLDDILYFKAIAELETSLSLAKEKGCAKSFSTKKARKAFIQLPYIQRLLKRLLKSKRNEIENGVMEYGLRNSALNTVGPTGTISLVTDNCSSGIEPIFKLSYTRKSRISEDQKIYHFPLLKYIGEEVLSMSDEEVKKKYNYVDSFDLNYHDRIRTQSTVQKWTDASVSSTINLKNDATVKDIYNIYWDGWKNGLKGITVFRDGSKTGIFDSGINNKEKEDKYLINSDLVQNYLKEEKKELNKTQRAYRYVKYWKKVKVYITVTVNSEGKPKELFANVPHEAGFDSSGIYRPELLMEKKSYWDAICRMTSLLLRLNTPIELIIKQLEKSSPTMMELPSIINMILRNFLNYDDEKIEKIKTEEVGGNLCHVCGKYGMIYQGGCQVCVLCGDSKCG